MNGTELNGSSGKLFTVPAFIDNAPVPTDGLKTFDVVNGKSDEVVHRASSATLDIVKAATESSWRAYQSWKSSPLQTRQHVLSKFADILEQRAEEFINVTVSENSGGQQFVQFTQAIAVSMVRQVAASVLSIHGTVISPYDDPSAEVHGLVFKEAIGPVLLIPP